MRKIIIGVTAFWLFPLIFLPACKKDYVSEISTEPVITINEIGISNSKIAYAGHDLHVDADIEAAARIASIKLQITLAETNYGWDVVKTYTGNYKGLKKADFHEHLEVPDNARTGLYNLILIVSDEGGRSTQSKVSFEVAKDASLPGIAGLSLKTSASIVNISGVMNAPKGIDKLEVQLQSSAWTRAFIYNDAAMVGQTTFQLDKNIDVTDAPAGHYHVNIQLTDKTAKSTAYHYHFDK